MFQFESDGIRELLKRLKPDNIRDIIACTALYRPGPARRRHGRRVRRLQARPQEAGRMPHPIMEEVLAETYGVMVYQEQVMRILNRLGGIELSSAYACIKAISKKKQEIIDRAQGGLRRRAPRTSGLAEETAAEIFDLIVKFGGYGFNKSHTAAYAHVATRPPISKPHYTPEFMAALLTSEIEDGNKRDIMVEHIDDARRLGVPTCCRRTSTTSDADFTVARRQDRLRPDRDQGPAAAGAAEAIASAAHGRRAVQGPFRFLRAHRPQGRQPGGPGTARQGRRPRLSRRPSQPAARGRAAGLAVGRRCQEDRARGQTQPLRRAARRRRARHDRRRRGGAARIARNGRRRRS